MTDEAEQFKIDWKDNGREPQAKPNPKFPDGVDIDVSLGAESCATMLPYPAQRCGYYVVRCKKCDYVVAITTAGRPDDPRKVTVPCKKSGNHAVPGKIQTQKPFVQ